MTVQNFFSQIGWDTQVRPGNIITQALYTPQHRYILTKCKNYLHSADQRWDEMFVFVIRKIQLSFEITNFFIFARICSFQLQLSNVFFACCHCLTKRRRSRELTPYLPQANQKNSFRTKNEAPSLQKLEVQRQEKYGVYSTVVGAC